MTDITWRADNIETISNFFGAAECEEYIRMGESMGFEAATLFAPRGVKDHRNNDRVIVDDADRARELYERLAVHLAPSFQHRWTPVGLNERLRLYRYDVGQKFDWHRDGHFERDNGERSQFTFMVYLNDDFEGGRTSFCDDTGRMPDGPLLITPERGMALLFQHPIMHRGDPVTKGRKYVLRTDVMYRRNV
ncbi:MULTISPECIES: 2OG-Fe(II) oxygenase [unclassified Bradyrhizobium]|uniref:2OG-Fe(II) oxygenase n=1 Tax=unclassified Bradyrhizobium TaxID=2631580 RepID=UPI0029168BAD|nr:MULTISPECIES: 2OG-Fe(II) oxygenase [unclassified Bradyrhizobium]